MKRIQTDVVIIGGGIVGTWLALELACENIDVVIVERGDTPDANKSPSADDLLCTARHHAGSYIARNHVLGGNSAFWGGGLIRQDSNGAIWGDFEISLDKFYARVEQHLKIPRLPARSTCQHGDGQWVNSEIFVLPGRKRNVSASTISNLSRLPNVKILTSSKIKEFRKKPGEKTSLDSIVVTNRGADIEIVGRFFVVTSGVIDSNLIVGRIQKELGLDTMLPIGQGLHDHMSVPLFRLSKTGNSDFLNSIAPRFANGLIAGKRFETRIDGNKGIGGFLHFQFLFDEVSPYRELKSLSSMVQRRAKIVDIVKEAAKLVPHLCTFLNIGYKRLLHRQLYISAEVPIIATLDFESCGSKSNQIKASSNGEKAAIAWDLTPDDEKNFSLLANRANDLCQNFAASYGIKFTPQFDIKNEGQTVSHLHKFALDAYHLGGGLAVGNLLDKNLKVQGIDNLSVISTAAFVRPGIVNPVLTLLALASRFADKTKEKMARTV